MIKLIKRNDINLELLNKIVELNIDFTDFFKDFFELFSDFFDNDMAMSIFHKILIKSENKSA